MYAYFWYLKKIKQVKHHKRILKMIQNIRTCKNVMKCEYVQFVSLKKRMIEKKQKSLCNICLLILTFTCETLVSMFSLPNCLRYFCGRVQPILYFIILLDSPCEICHLQAYQRDWVVDNNYSLIIIIHKKYFYMKVLWISNFNKELLFSNMSIVTICSTI